MSPLESVSRRWTPAHPALLRTEEPGGVLGKVREDNTGARATNRGKCLQHHSIAIDPAETRCSFNHAELSAYLIGGQRNFEPVIREANHIQVSQRRLHHDHVRALSQ